MLWSASSHFPHPYPWQLPVYILVLWVQLFCIPHVNVIIQYLSFQVWPISLSIMPFSFIHVVANDRISFFLMTEYCSVIQTHTHTDTDFSDGSVVTSKRCKWCGFDPWVGKIPWRKKWKPTPVFLPGKSHEQRSLVGYSPWGWKELGMTEWLNTLKMSLKTLSTFQTLQKSCAVQHILCLLKFWHIFSLFSLEASCILNLITKCYLLCLSPSICLSLFQLGYVLLLLNPLILSLAVSNPVNFPLRSWVECILALVQSPHLKI